MHLFKGISWSSGALRPVTDGPASLSGPRLPADSRYPSKSHIMVPNRHYSLSGARITTPIRATVMMVVMTESALATPQLAFSKNAQMEIDST